MTLPGLLAVAAFLQAHSAPPPARLLKETLGPVEVVGAREFVHGMIITKTVLMRERGWIRAVSVRLVGRDGTPSDGGRRLLLYSLEDLDPAQPVQTPFFGGGPGDGRAAVPEGMGVEVEAGRLYRLRAVLGGEETRAAAYDVEFEIEFVPRSPGGPPLRAVRPQGIRFLPSQGKGERSGYWEPLPAGPRVLSYDLVVSTGRAVGGHLVLSPSLAQARVVRADGSPVLSRRAGSDTSLDEAATAGPGARWRLEADYVSKTPALVYVLGVLYLADDAPAR